MADTEGNAQLSTVTYREKYHVCGRCGRVGRRGFSYLRPIDEWRCTSDAACARREAASK